MIIRCVLFSAALAVSLADVEDEVSSIVEYRARTRGKTDALVHFNTSNMDERKFVTHKIVWKNVLVMLSAYVADMCDVTSNFLSPVDVSHPVVDNDVVHIFAHNLLHPIKYTIAASSRNHLVLVPKVKKGGQYLPFIKGGPMKSPEAEFKLAFITFSKESRHWFAGRAYPMEAEIYFYDTRYNSFKRALMERAVVALSLLYKGDHGGKYGKRDENEVFIASSASAVQFYSGAIIPETVEPFYFYNGSLIDSDCHEPVLWIVDKRVRSMSMSHMALLSSHMATSKGEDDYYFRERSVVQPLGSRQIYCSPEVKSMSSRFYKSKKPDSIDHFFLCKATFSTWFS